MNNIKYTNFVTLFISTLVGEPLNNEAWDWYYEVVGEKRCDIVDTWWQTGNRFLAKSPFDIFFHM